MKQGQAEPVTLPKAVTGAPPAVELRHLRYFVALADAGSFTHAAERMFIAQPTLSQQIRRLEEMVGTPLLQRRREGLRLTDAGAVLLEESRTVLSLIDHGVSRTCPRPSPSGLRRGCGSRPRLPVWTWRGWRQPLMASSRRSVSAGPMPAWDGWRRRVKRCRVPWR